MPMRDSELQKATERRLVAALPLLEKKLELKKATLGLEHRSTLKSMEILAKAYKYAGRKAELLPLIEQTLELRKVAFGLEDWETRTLMEKLAFEYQLAGRVSDALPLYEQLLTLNHAEFGPEDPNTLYFMNHLAVALAATGRSAEARQYAEKTLPSVIERCRRQQHSTLGAMGTLTNTCLAADQPATALPFFDEYIASHPDLAATADLAFSGMLIAVSARLLKHREFEVAEKYLRQSLMIREKQLPDSYQHFNAKATLGGALAGQKKFQEAEPLLVEGYAGMKEREANIPPAVKILRLPEAIQRLVDLYVAWEKPEQAAEWQNQLDQLETLASD